MFAGSYCGSPPALADIAARWNGDPVLILILGSALALALKAGNRLAAGGVALLALAFVSPLCAASVALFSARSVHHLVLILAALVFAMAMDRRIEGRMRLPVVPATIVMTAVLWAWHIPALYDAALANMLVYWLMQATILGSALAFWVAIRRASAVGAVGGLLGAMVQMGMLGALLTFAPEPLYIMHALAAPSWGLSGLADQQLAGLIMWVGGMAPFAIGAIVIARHGWQSEAGSLAHRSAPRTAPEPAQ